MRKHPGLNLNEGNLGDDQSQTTAESRIAVTFGLLVGTLGSIRDYTADDLRIRIRYAVAVLGGNAREIREAELADGKMQGNFDEDGNRIA
jgi:hypothetical protein